jgi:hypothetical protein
VVAGCGEVGVDQAPSSQGLVGLPVPGDGLVSFGGFDSAFGGVGGPLDAEVGGEQPDLVGVLGQPGREGVGGVLPSPSQSRSQLWTTSLVTAAS